MPPLHRFRLIACTDPTDLPQARVGTIIAEIDNAETCMLNFINGAPLELGPPIPPPFPLSRRKIWWAENITNLPHGQAPSPLNKGPRPQNAQGDPGQSKNQERDSTQDDGKSKTRKAREAMLNRWKRVKKGTRGIFGSRYAGPLFPEPEGSESDSSDESVYEESPSPTAERRRLQNRPFPVWDLSGFQQMADGTYGYVGSDTEPLLHDGDDGDDAARVDSATRHFFRRASSTLGLTKLVERLRRSSDQAT